MTVVTGTDDIVLMTEPETVGNKQQAYKCMFIHFAHTQHSTSTVVSITFHSITSRTTTFIATNIVDTDLLTSSIICSTFINVYMNMDRHIKWDDGLSTSNYTLTITHVSICC